MADKIKFLTGQLSDLGTAINRGQVYFAIDGDDKGKIVFDAPIDATTTKRIVMTENADNASHANTADLAEMANKDSSGQQIASTYIKNLSYIDQATNAPKLQAVLGSGGVLAAINVPVASTTNSGIVTMGSQAFRGTKQFDSVRVTGVFNYVGIKSDGKDVDHSVWYSTDEAKGRPSYDADGFTYNPSTKTLKVTNVEGLVSNATADNYGNTIASYIRGLTINSTSNAMSITALLGDGTTYTENIPRATTSTSGIVTASNQLFGGVKSFQDGINLMYNTINDVGNLYFISPDGGKRSLHYPVGDQYRTIWVDDDGILYYSDLHARNVAPTTSYEILHTGNASKLDNYLVSLAWTNGTTAGPTGTATLRDGQTVAVPSLPIAGSSRSGVITTGAQTIAGIKTHTSDIYFANSGNTGAHWVRGTSGGNDYWRFGGGATAADAGYAEIATADSGIEPIYVRQYTGVFTTLTRTLTLLDANGNTYIPGALYDKTGNELLSTNYVATLNGAQRDTTYSITGLNQIGTAIPSVLNVPINMVGSAITEDKIYLVGTTEQSAKAQNGYSHSQHYIDEDDFLFSHGNKINYWARAHVNNTNNYPYHNIIRSKRIVTNFMDYTGYYYISQNYNEGGYGYFRLSVRRQAGGTAITVKLTWLVREAIAENCITAAIYKNNNGAYVDLYYHSVSAWNDVTIQQLNQGRRYDLYQDIFFLCNSDEDTNATASDKKGSTSFASIDEGGLSIRGAAYTEHVSATDAGNVNYAKSARVATIDSGNHDINNTYIRTMRFTNHATQPTLNYTTGSGVTTSVNIPVANTSQAGVITTGTQSIAGNKTFSGTTTTVNRIVTGVDKSHVNNDFGINLRNSDIIGVNNIYFNDVSNDSNEGINFRMNNDSESWRTIWADTDGTLYWSDIRTNGGTATQNYEILHTGNASMLDNYLTSWTWENGTSAGPIGVGTHRNGTTISTPAIPSASTTTSGIVTTGNQAFNGLKGFNGGITMNWTDILETKSLYFIGNSDGTRGLHYIVDGGVKTIWVNQADGVLYYSNTHTGNTSPTENYEILHTGNASMLDNYLTAWSWTNGTTSGPTATGTHRDGQSVAIPAIPAASGSQSGIITTGAQTIAGAKTFSSNIYLSSPGNTGSKWVRGQAGNDYWRFGGGATSIDSGYAEIATGDNGNESIYVRQYSGDFATLRRTLTLLDGSGNTHIPGALYDKSGNELLSTKYVATLVGSKGSVDYTITPQNQIGTALTNVINVPMNLVGSANTSNKIFLVGTTSQSVNAQTGYSHAKHYIGSDDFLYSNNSRVNYYAVASVANTNNYPYHRIAYTPVITGAYQDYVGFFYVTQNWNGGGFGLIRVAVRTNNSSAVSSVELKWLMRQGIAADRLQVALNNVYGNTYADLYYRSTGTYGCLTIKQIQVGHRSSPAQSYWTLCNSTEVHNTTATDKLTSTSYASITDAALDLRGATYTNIVSGVDSGIANTAHSATAATNDSAGQNISTTYVKSISYTNHATQPKLNYVKGGGASTSINIPVASSTNAGVITTGTQTIAGQKTFTNAIHTRSGGLYQNGAYGIDLRNSDIIGANSIYMADTSENAGEGISFRLTNTSSGTWRTIWADGDGVLYWSGAHAAGGAATNNYEIIHTNNLDSYENYVTGWTWTGGTTAGPTATITRKNGSTVAVAAIPSASSVASGIVTTGTQYFNGLKVFMNSIIAAADKTKDGTNTYGLDMRNSDIINANSIYFADKCANSNEGIHFYISDTDAEKYASIWADENGTLYWTNGHAIGALPTNNYELLHSGNLDSYDNYITAFSWGTQDWQGAFAPIITLKDGSTISVPTVPIAGSGQGGIVTKFTQTFAGEKTFNNSVIMARAHTLTGNGYAGINMRNSDISNVNTIYLDSTTDANKGIQFHLDAENCATIWADENGVLYWTNNHAVGTLPTENYEILHSGNASMLDNYLTSWTWTNGTAAGPTATGTHRDGQTVAIPALPAASGSQSGIITTGSQTIAGIKTHTSDIYFANSGNTGAHWVRGTAGGNDYWRFGGGATASNAGYAEIATADDHNEPIYVRQYTGAFTTLTRTLTLLDGSGNTHIPGTLYDKSGNELLSTKYVATLTGAQGTTTYSITPKNQLGTNLTNVINVPTNLVGSANATAKIFLVGTLNQSATAQTGYSHAAHYIDSDDFLYSNSNKVNYYSMATIGSTNNYPYHRIAYTGPVGGGVDAVATFYVGNHFGSGSGFGIIEVLLRGNQSSAVGTVKWLVRHGLAEDSIQMGVYFISNASHADLYYKNNLPYNNLTVYQIQSGNRTAQTQIWTLCNSTEASGTTTTDKLTSTSYASIADAALDLRGAAYTNIISGVDSGRVDYAKTSGTTTNDSAGQNINTTYIKALSYITHATQPKLQYTKGNGSTGTINMPVAGATLAGVVTTAAQAFKGNKTFNDSMCIKATSGYEGLKIVPNADVGAFITLAGPDAPETFVSFDNSSWLIGNQGGTFIISKSDQTVSPQPTLINADGIWSINYASFLADFNVPSLYSDGWIETGGATGWRSTLYGGGWYMNNSTHVKIYGNKKLWLNNDLNFDGTHHIHWTDGTYQQRIFITDDSVADTAVFTFQQSQNSGEGWYNLFTIKDNGNIIPRGELHFDDTTGRTLIRAISSNKNTTLLRVQSVDYSGDSAGFGFSLVYNGVNNDNANSLVLKADNQHATAQVDAVTVYQSGDITLAKTLGINGENIAYKLYVNGSSWLNGDVYFGTSSTTKLDAAGNLTVRTLGIANTSASSGLGISLYGGAVITGAPTYGMFFGGTSTFGTLRNTTATTFGITSDWATYLTMSNSATRGWIFRKGSTNVAGITGNGTFMSTVSSATHLNANRGLVIIDSTAAVGYNMLFRMKSTNGVYTSGTHNHSYDLYYTTDATITAGTNAITYSISLLNQNGVTTLRRLLCSNGNSNNSTTNISYPLQVNGDSYISGSIRGLSTSGGIYWNAYADTTSDTTNDQASIYLIPSGVAGGTELRMSITNNDNDVLNFVTPAYIYFNGKRAFQVNDNWLRINENLAFTNGIYTGNSLVRTDNVIQVGSNGSAFYANSSGNTYVRSHLGVAGTNTGYNLYVNGTSYLNGNTMHNGVVYFANGTTYYITAQADAVLRRGIFSGTSTSETATGAYYVNGAIEIREANWVHETQSAFAYAPRIGFHWAGRIAASLSFHSDGIFYLRKQDGTTRATLDASINGNASTATRLNSLGNLECETGRTSARGGVYTYNYYTGSYGPASYCSVIGFGRNTAGHAEIAAHWGNNTGLYFRTLRDNTSNWTAWNQVWVRGNAVTSAVWNDYAECRQSECTEPGYVLTENGDDTLSKTTDRLQAFAGVSSDTWGFSQGETAKAKTPIAVAGRVLVYTFRDRNEYKPGDCVCAAPGGTVDIMTRDEVLMNPDKIVGTVSCVPDYEEWGGGEGADRDPVKVNGRIWIKVK